MKIQKIHILSALLGAVLLFSTSYSSGLVLNQNPGNLEINTSNIAMVITGGGNVPSYQFWDLADNSTKYTLRFTTMFEATEGDTGTAGVYDQSSDQKVSGSVYGLASLSWDFGTVIENDAGGVDFNLTSSDGAIQFTNHLASDDASDLKFDVKINGYDFVSSESILVIGFKVTTINTGSNGDEETAEVDQDDEETVSINTATFQSEPTATDDNGIINVGLSTGSEGSNSMIYLAYGQFVGNLVHDPTIGVDSNSSGEGLLGSNNLLLSILAIGIPVLIYRKRK